MSVTDNLNFLAGFYFSYFLIQTILEKARLGNKS